MPEQEQHPPDDSVCTVCGFPFTFNIETGLHAHLTPGGDWYTDMDASHDPAAHDDPFRRGVNTKYGLVISELGALELLTQARWVFRKDRLCSAARTHLSIPQDDAQAQAYSAELDDLSRGDAERSLEELTRTLPVKLWDGTYVTRQAWNLHQPFKEQFLASLDGEQPHTLHGNLIRVWIRNQ